MGKYKRTTNPTVVVVVEDDADTRYVIQPALEDKYTVHVMTTITPDEVTTLQADMVFMDLWLNGQSGADLCSSLKQNDATRHIPVILCSAVHGLPAIQLKCQVDPFIV